MRRRILRSSSFRCSTANTPTQKSAAREIRRRDAAAVVLFYRPRFCDHRRGRRADGGRGEITAGDFTAFILYLQRMIWYLIALGYVVNLYQRGTASLKRFNAILEAEPAIRDAPRRHTSSRRSKDRIEFRDLTFAYNGKPVLQEHRSQRSTRARQSHSSAARAAENRRLSAWFRACWTHPTDRYSSMAYRCANFPLEQLRRSIGFVPQETFLFSDTLAENIAMGVEGEGEKGEREKGRRGRKGEREKGRKGEGETKP